MKKFVSIGVVVQLALTVFIFLSVINSLELNNLLYKDKEKITILVESNSIVKDPKEQASYIIDSAKKNHIRIFKYIFSSDTNLKIYTNQEMKNGFTALGDPNKKDVESLKSGTDFIWTNSKIDLELKKFTAIPETGISGIYYIQGDNPKYIHAFLKEISQLGKIKTNRSNSYELNVHKAFFEKYFLLIVWFLLLAVNLAILIQFLMKQTKKITLLKLFGWHTKDILYSFLSPLIRIFLLSLSIVIFIVVAYFSFVYKGIPFITSFLALLLLVTLLFIAVYAFIIYLTIQFIYRSNPSNHLKGNNYGSLGIAFNLFCKLAIATTIISLGAFLLKEQHALIQHQNQNAYWEKTKNIYAVQLRFITSDIDEYSPYEKALKNFFNEATDKKGLFLIDSTNYEKLSIGKPLYEMNTNSEREQLTFPAGKSIVINKNYFTHNPILDVHGQSPLDKIIVSPNYLNILVPEALKPFEEEISLQYTKYFAFLKRLTSDPSKQKDDRVNIIYVKDHQNYFTYNPNIEKKDFTIVDPISIVDTGNLDDSFYAAWLTSSAFVKSEKMDGFNYLLPIIIQTHTSPSIQNTVSLYDFRSEELTMKKMLVYTISILLICLTIVQIFNVISSYQLIIEKYRYSLHIKRIFGYSFMKLFSPIVLPNVLLDVMLVGILFIFYRNKYVVFVIACWIVLEGLTTVLTLNTLKQTIHRPTIEKKGD
ncbi:ABC transporter permease [Enterococcus villorum]|uniref:ABC transporter permease n=1 Tax=Enterococcus villorum TaxID=112904 RepID=A0A1V8YBQ0_9ENTE|nr:ABC transporter permease [Enterococcus villorum]OQO70030.1 ABC transporter permease [Enterococcus villorum]OQO71932.1 ABC transporter permease [Enterococcus villorum]